MPGRDDSGGSGGVNRREFFSRSAALSVAGGATLFGGLVASAPGQGAAVAQAPSQGRGGRRGYGYGPLSPAGDHLSLPPGFQYSVVSVEGLTMDDGYPAPKAMDGTGAFALPNGNVLLIRNHEDSDRGDWFRARPAGSTSTSAGILNPILDTHYGPRHYAYDGVAGGGTTSLEIEPHGHRRLVRQWWSLVGTKRNCSGGVTPWGSWLTGEETMDGPHLGGGLHMDQPHGYLFEVPVDTHPHQPAIPEPLTRLGRFIHEACAVDPATGIIYETEDNGDSSGLYRFVPDVRPTAPGQLAHITGQLQMLRVANTNQYVTAINQQVGVPLAASWVTIANPDAGTSSTAVFNQGFAAGGARFRRLEGAWFAKGKLYFSATNGGDAGLGQIWVHDPQAQTLTLLFESADVDVLDAPDNLTVTPSGGLIICEDGAGMQLLRGISPSGEIFDFAKNIHNNIEFAGPVFSPDGRTLFVNLFGRLTTRTLSPYTPPGPITGPTQVPIVGESSELAMTLAIWGPWASGLL